MILSFSQHPLNPTNSRVQVPHRHLIHVSNRTLHTKEPLHLLNLAVTQESIQRRHRRYIIVTPTPWLIPMPLHRPPPTYTAPLHRIQRLDKDDPNRSQEDLFRHSQARFPIRSQYRRAQMHPRRLSPVSWTHYVGVKRLESSLLSGDRYLQPDSL